MNEKMNKLMVLEMGSCLHRGPVGECGGGGGGGGQDMGFSQEDVIVI